MSDSATFLTPSEITALRAAMAVAHDELTSAATTLEASGRNPAGTREAAALLMQELDKLPPG